MRVIVHVSAFYDWVPVPPDVKVTDADVAARRVKPGRDGEPTMRTTRKQASYTTIHVAESTIIGRIIHEMIPRPGIRKAGLCNRSEALAEMLDENVMPHHAHPSHFTGFEVEADQGPDEAAMRAALAQYVEAKHHVTGEPLIAAEDVDRIVAKYLEPRTHEHHVDHLHARFKVAKKAA